MKQLNNKQKYRGVSTAPKTSRIKMKTEAKKICQIFESRSDLHRRISGNSWGIIKKMTPQEFENGGSRVRGIGRALYKSIMDTLCRGGHHDRRINTISHYSDANNDKRVKPLINPPRLSFDVLEPKVTNLSGANEKPTVEELQSAVGGNIEVAVSDDDLRVQIIIDEEGKLKGKPMNMGATEHWYRLMQLDTNPDEFWTFEEFVTKVDFLVGDVVILHGGARLD